jgi:hypothetical protein
VWTSRRCRQWHVLPQWHVVLLAHFLVLQSGAESKKNYMRKITVPIFQPSLSAPDVCDLEFFKTRAGFEMFTAFRLVENLSDIFYWNLIFQQNILKSSIAYFKNLCRQNPKIPHKTPPKLLFFSFYPICYLREWNENTIDLNSVSEWPFHGFSFKNYTFIQRGHTSNKIKPQSMRCINRDLFVFNVHSAWLGTFNDRFDNFVSKFFARKNFGDLPIVK